MRASLLLAAAFGINSASASRFEAAKLVSGFLGLDKQRETADGGSKLTLIGAGFSRTGTKSTEAALLELGHKIYDTRSILENGHADRWAEAARRLRDGDDGGVAELLAEMEAAGYTATLDFPMNLFGHSLAALRPDAKILFTTRDLDAWYASWYNVNVVLGVFVLRPWSWLVDFGFTEPICEAFGFHFIVARYPDHVRRPLPWFERLESLPSLDPPDSKARWIAFHERTRKALETDYPDRFLAFDVKSGWAPLLAFLEIDDAAKAASPFPRVNDMESLKTVRKVMDVVAVGLPLWLALLAFGIACLLGFVLPDPSKAKRA